MRSPRIDGGVFGHGKEIGVIYVDWFAQEREGQSKNKECREPFAHDLSYLGRALLG